MKNQSDLISLSSFTLSLMSSALPLCLTIRLQLHDEIYRLLFYSNSLIHILSLSNSHNKVASIQKNRGDKSHRVIVALLSLILPDDQIFDSLNFNLRFLQLLILKILNEPL